LEEVVYIPIDGSVELQRAGLSSTQQQSFETGKK